MWHRRIPVIARTVAAAADDRFDGPQGMTVDRAEQRVVVADDDVLLREGVAGLLERAGFAVAGQAGDAAELLRVVRDQEPDLAIVDIRMPPRHETEGLEAALVIRRELPGVAILVLSAHAEVAEAMELLATGRGIGYVLKSRVSKVEDFIEAVDRVIDGASVVDPAIVQELVSARRVEDPLAELTPREREVLALVGRGRSNAEIADELVLSPLTAKTHVARLFSKLAARDRAQLVVLAYESGLVVPGER